MGRYWAAWAGLAVFVAACLCSIGKPLTSDEAEIGAAARAILTSGTPTYFIGAIPDKFLNEQLRWSYTATPLANHQYGLWHSPAYLYVLAISYAVLGVTDWSARLVGAVCVLATLGVLWGLARLQARSSAQLHESFSYLAVLYLCSPFILQVGLVASFDNTLLSVTSFALLHEYLRMRQRTDARSATWLVLLVTLCCWAKEYGIVFLIAAVAAYELLNRDLRRLARAAAIFLAGVVLFTATWLLYCHVFDLPAQSFVRINYVQRYASETGSALEHFRLGGWERLALAWKVTWACTLSWTSCYFAVLALAVVVWRAREFYRTRECQAIDLVVLYGLAIVGAAKLLRPSILTMRYEYPAAASLLFGMAFLLQRELGPLRPRVLAIAAALAALHVLAVGDPVLGTLRSGRSLGFFWGYATASAVVLGAFVVLRPNRNGVLSSLLALLLACNLGLSWTQTAPYLTTADWLSDYGSSGVRDVAVYLQRAGVAGTYPVLPKDVGFHVSVALKDTDFRWLSQVALEQAVAAGPAEIDALLEPRVRHIVFKGTYVQPLMAQHLQRLGFGAVGQVGDFLVLAR